MSNKENLKIIYKLLNDFLLAILIFFFAVILAESALPTIISRYIPIYIFALLIALDVFGIYFLANKIGIENQKSLSKKNTLFILGIFFLLILNSVLKFGIILSLVIAIFSTFTAYLLYQVLLEKE